MPNTPPYTVLIVDDEAPAREKIAQFLSQLPHDFHILEAGSVQEAIAIFSEELDFLFLDIQMPQQDGFAFIERIGLDNCPPIIFSTAYDQFALKAFEVHAADYLLKPYDLGRFQSAVEQVIRQIEQKSQPQIMLEQMLQSFQREQKKQSLLWASHRQKLVPIRVEQITHIEADGNYVQVHTEAGKKYLIRKALSTLEAELDPSVFVRVHRSCILNTLHIQEMHPKSHGDLFALLKNGEKVLVSRRYKGNLL